MLSIRTRSFFDPPALALGLMDLGRAGWTPRGLLFLALDGNGTAHLALPERERDVEGIKVGDKLALAFPLAGRFYHFDSIHCLRPGHFVFNGDRRLHHPGNADDAAGAVTEFLRGVGATSVFFGCTPHQPGTWLASRAGSEPLHDSGFVEVVPVKERLLARRIMDHRLWLLEADEKVEGHWPVFESPLGNLLMLERRAVRNRLVLSCERGLVEVDLGDLPAVREVERLQCEIGVAVVGRIEDGAFAVTYGRPRPWGLDEIGPAQLVGAEDESLASLGTLLGV